MRDLFNMYKQQFYTELPKNASKKIVCWYPSAGKDFKSVEMWLRPEHPNTLVPQFYFFTDKAYKIDIENKSIRFNEQELLNEIDNLNKVDFLSQRFDIDAKQIFDLSNNLQELIITNNQQLFIDRFNGPKALLLQNATNNYEAFRLLLYSFIDSIEDLQVGFEIDYANITLKYQEFNENSPQRTERAFANIALLPIENKDFFILTEDKHIPTECLYIKRTGGDTMDYINNIATDLNTKEIYCHDVYLEWLGPKLNNYNQNAGLVHCLSDEFQHDDALFFN
ncbi:hypothetical protein [Gaetbulibacter jejuensis]|uniref:hypothetical protein n=1 Tax=Gaetbulibacter jejuensis TaxID=584607 RepID=UPI003008D69E